MCNHDGSGESKLQTMRERENHQVCGTNKHCEAQSVRSFIRGRKKAKAQGKWSGVAKSMRVCKRKIGGGRQKYFTLILKLNLLLLVAWLQQR